MTILSVLKGSPQDKPPALDFAGMQALNQQLLTGPESKYHYLSTGFGIAERKKVLRETYAREYDIMEQQLIESQGSFWTNVIRPILPVFAAMATAGAAVTYFAPVAAGAVGGAEAIDVASFAAYDAALAEGAAAGVGSTAGTGAVFTGTSGIVGASGLTGMEIEAAAGSGVAPWVEPEAASSLFSGSGGYIKTAGEVLGVGAAGKSLIGTAVQPLMDRANQFVNEVFGGSGGSTTPGGMGSGGGSGGGGGLLNAKTLPWLLIGITVLGAILILKRRVL